MTEKETIYAYALQADGGLEP